MRRLLFIIISFTLLATYAQEVFSQEESIFAYQAAGRRDPFAPLVSKDGKLLVTYGVINSIKDVVLQGVLYDENGESIAILNDMPLKEDETIGSMVLKKIEKDKVVIVSENKEHIIKLKE